VLRCSGHSALLQVRLSCRFMMFDDASAALMTLERHASRLHP
jgi:hypothetical protein